MSLLGHPQWAALRFHLRVEPYDRDTNQHGDVRHRIEVTRPDPALEPWLRAVVMPCVHCGTLMRPINTRASWGTWYYRCTCPGNLSCRNSKEARVEYRAIRDDLLRDPIPAAPSPQGGLFEDPCVE